VGDLSSGEKRQPGLVAPLSFRLQPILGHTRVRVNLMCTAWAGQGPPSASGGFKQQGESQGWTGLREAPGSPPLPASLPKQSPGPFKPPGPALPCPARAGAGSLETYQSPPRRFSDALLSGSGFTHGRGSGAAWFYIHGDLVKVCV